MIENSISLGKTSLMYSGSMFLNLASFLETKSPITTEIEIKNPYHLILKKPKFKNVSPGDWIKLDM